MLALTIHLPKNAGGLKKMKKGIGKRIIGLSLSGLLILGTVWFGSSSESVAENSHLLGTEPSKIANVTHYEINLDGAGQSTYIPANTYAASTPKVVTLLDNNNHINVAYPADGKLIIQKYDDNMELIKSIELNASLPLFGDVICDENGYYYAVWGCNDDDSSNCETINVTKYDENGKIIKSLGINGYSSIPYRLIGEGCGTRYPFSAGNCDMDIQNGIIAINYARQMYNGHQSNMVIYVDTANMVQRYGDSAYTSHSFDQRVYALSDNRFAILNHGDAYPRSFKISIENFAYSGGTLYWDYSSMDSDCFHFREGANRDHGYNETFAQLGGIAEINNNLIFVASSERELSAIPKETGYLGHDVARDLFMQVFIKEGGTYSLKPGESRTVQGTKPSSAETELRLNGDEVDNGVIWLTSYDDEHYAAHPKVVSLGGNKAAIMWEKRSYNTNEKWYYTWKYDSDQISDTESYCAVIDGNGNVITDTMFMQGCVLSADTDPVCLNGKIYWATNDDYGAYIHCLNPDSYSDIVMPNGISFSDSECDLYVNDTIALTPVITPSGATSGGIKWESSDPSIATVDSNGKVTGKNEGTVDITATTKLGKKVATIKITVYAINLTSLSPVEDTVEVELNDSFSSYKKIAVTGQSKESGFFPSETLIWKSSDESVAKLQFENTKEGSWARRTVGDESVEASGIFENLVLGEKTGSAEITVTTKDGKLSAVIKVNVIKPVKSVWLITPYQSKLAVGERYQFNCNYDPRSATGDTTAVWTSSDTSVATVDSEGTVTGISKGKAEITVTIQGISDSVVVEVYEDGKSQKPSTDTDEKNDKYVPDHIDKDLAEGHCLMYRMYNPNSGEHFYTGSKKEGNKLVDAGWNYEGIAWEGPTESNTPVYRLYNPNVGEHHYTPNKKERDKLIKLGWNDEGIGWYSDDNEGTPLYRLYNPNATTGNHHYTTSTRERDKLVKIGWNDEGIGWYGY